MSRLAQRGWRSGAFMGVHPARPSGRGIGRAIGVGALLSWVLGALLLGLATSGQVAAPVGGGSLVPVATQAPYPPPTTGVTVQPGEVPVGGCVSFSGHGFQPGTTVVVTDNGTVIARPVVAGDGTWSVRVCFPDPDQCGQHTLTATGLASDGRQVSLSSTVTVICGGTTSPQPVVSGQPSTAPTPGVVQPPPLGGESPTPAPGVATTDTGCDRCVPFWRHPISDVWDCWRWLLLLIVLAVGMAVGWAIGRRRRESRPADAEPGA